MCTAQRYTAFFVTFTLWLAVSLACEMKLLMPCHMFSFTGSELCLWKQQSLEPCFLLRTVWTIGDSIVFWAKLSTGLYPTASDVLTMKAQDAVEAADTMSELICTLCEAVTAHSSPPWWEWPFSHFAVKLTNTIVEDMHHISQYCPGFGMAWVDH